MNCLTDEQLVALVVDSGEDATRDHLARCPACADRLADLRAQLARLAGAVAGPDSAHDAVRGRLLAALDQEPMPVSLFWRMAMNRRNWAVAAVAATVTLVVCLGWPGGAASALAEALRPFAEAKSFSCDMVNLKDGKPWDGSLPADKRGQLKTRLSWAAPGSLRLDMRAGGKLMSQVILPHGKPGVLLAHAEKEYSEIDRAAGKEEAVVQLINALAAYAPGDKKPAGSDDVEGVKAPRFDLVVADPEKRDWHYRIWVHPVTKRALRVEFALLPGTKLDAKDVQAARLERFEWDVKTEGLFDPKPPAGYKLVATKPAERTEAMTKLIVQGLKAYREVAGAYPKIEPFNAPKVAEELGKLAKKKVDVEALQGIVLIGVLQSASKEAVYLGKTVGAEDKDKVLFRWKLEDGKYRVVFGDLRAETVSGDKLKELEKQ